MAYNYDFSPIDYLKRRERYYHRKIVKWTNRLKLPNEGWHGDIKRTIEHFTLRKDQFSKAINQLK